MLFFNLPKVTHSLFLPNILNVSTTGMYQNRLGEKFEGPLSGKTQYDEGMPLEVTTMAEMLKSEG